MKRLFLFLLALLFSLFSFAQGNLILTLADTVLTAEQVAAKNGNPTVLMYPLNMKDKIPQMQCKQTEGLGPFSVAADRQVYFSPGNLQYNAASGSHQCADGTTQPGTWRFAGHQWDTIGTANSNASSTYNGWIDLFSWGTSGWNSGANEYQPWVASSNYEDHNIGGSSENGLTGEYANADWGVYNQIDSDAPGTWRILTKDEWDYVFSGRANAGNLCGQATVNGVTGVILLPDDWVAPDGITFIADYGVEFTTNQYDLSQWNKMEDAGAVFLPAAGYRGCSGSVYGVGQYGYCWSSTPNGSDYAWYFYFNSSKIYMRNDYRCGGISVRLVH